MFFDDPKIYAKSRKVKASSFKTLNLLIQDRFGSAETDDPTSSAK